MCALSEITKMFLKCCTHSSHKFIAPRVHGRVLAEPTSQASESIVTL
jgi:hypothetical protein